jgi:hypothetical protein
VEAGTTEAALSWSSLASSPGFSKIKKNPHACAIAACLLLSSRLNMLLFVVSMGRFGSKEGKKTAACLTYYDYRQF